MVTKEVYRDLLISKLIHAILEKIFIQQDGAKNHICEDDKEFNDALMEQDIDAVLYMQTLNSPDINLLDLGFLELTRVSMMPCQETKRNWYNWLAQPTKTIHNTSSIIPG